jgi:hypothetical protein
MIMILAHLQSMMILKELSSTPSTGVLVLLARSHTAIVRRCSRCE